MNIIICISKRYRFFGSIKSPLHTSQRFAGASQGLAGASQGLAGAFEGLLGGWSGLLRGWPRLLIGWLGLPNGANGAYQRLTGASWLSRLAGASQRLAEGF